MSTDGIFCKHIDTVLNWIELRKSTSLIQIWAPQSAAIKSKIKKNAVCECLLGTWSQDEPSVHSGKYNNTLIFWADPLCSRRMQLNEWLQLYTAHSRYPPEQLQRCLVATWLVPPETAAALVQVLCTPNKRCTSLQCHFIQRHICSVHACLASCNLPPALLAKLTLKVAYTVLHLYACCGWFRLCSAAGTYSFVLLLSWGISLLESAACGSAESFWAVVIMTVFCCWHSSDDKQLCMWS